MVRCEFIPDYSYYDTNNAHVRLEPTRAKFLTGTAVFFPYRNLGDGDVRFLWNMADLHPYFALRWGIGDEMWERSCKAGWWLFKDSAGNDVGSEDLRP